MHMDDISLSWCDISELVVPIWIILIDNSCWQWSYWIMLNWLLRKLQGRHHDLVSHSEVSVSTTFLVSSFVDHHTICNKNNTMVHTNGVGTDYRFGAPDVHAGLNGVRLAQCSIFSFLSNAFFILLYFFFWSLCCLSCLDLRLLITPFDIFKHFL